MKSSSLVRPFFFVALPVAAILVLIVYAGLEIRAHLTGSQQFAIEEVQILTDGPAKKEEIIRLAGIRIHSNIFSLNLEDTKKRVELNPWVHSATITRALPNKIQIRYVPQVPVAILNLGDSLFYVNSEGRAFSKITKGDSLQHPFIHLENASNSSELPPERLAAALAVIEWTKKSALVRPRDLGDIAVRGSVYSEENPLMVTLAYPPSTIVLKQRQKRSFFTVTFAENDIPQQTRRAELVLSHLMQQGKNPRLIRLELGKKIVVKMDQKL